MFITLKDSKKSICINPKHVVLISDIAEGGTRVYHTVVEKFYFFWVQMSVQDCDQRFEYDSKDDAIAARTAFINAASEV